MSPELLIAIVAGLGGMLGWGFADFFAKKTIDELGDIMTLAWAGVFGTTTFLLAALYAVVAQGKPVDIPTSPAVWFTLVFFGVLQAAVYLFVYRGFAKGQVGLLSPIFSSFAGIVALVSILFLGESASTLKITALLITFVGILVLNADIGAIASPRFRFNTVGGFGDVAIGTLFAALWTILWDRFVNGSDWLFYALYMFAFMTIAVFLFAVVYNLKFAVGKAQLWKFLAAIGVCETLAYIAISWGYGETSLVSIVSILSAAFALPTIILARLFLGERTTRTQSIGSLIIIVGVVFLAVV